MSDDFYTMVDSGDPAPDNEHITGVREERAEGEQTTTQAPKAMYAARIAEIIVLLGSLLHLTDLSILYLHDLITQYFYILMYVTG